MLGSNLWEGRSVGAVGFYDLKREHNRALIFFPESAEFGRIV
jgi:hypothetical protein